MQLQFGNTLMSEEHGPRELVDVAKKSEDAAFDFLVMSDHFHPWVPEQQHSPYAWAVLGAVATATESIHLGTFVTCPSYRYHPAVIAQKAAIALLSEDRFTLSLGSGERLNEHIVGGGWPSVTVRHERLTEAIEIIRLLWQGGYRSYRGEHFTVEDACVFDRPDQPIPIAVAVSGAQSVALAAAHADELVAIEPKADLVSDFRAAKGTAAHATCQIAVCYGDDADAARAVAHERFRWSPLGWKVMSELPNPVNFDAASAAITPEALAERIPCGPDVDAFVDAVRPFADAGFDRIAFVQVGDDQDGFLTFWQKELRDALITEFS